MFRMDCKLQLALLALVLIFQSCPSGAKTLSLATNDAVLVPVNEDGPVITGPGGQLMMESAHPASVQDEGEEADLSNAVIPGPGAPPVPLAPPMVPIVDDEPEWFRAGPDVKVTVKPVTVDPKTAEKVVNGTAGTTAKPDDNTVIWIVIVVLGLLLIALVVGITAFCIIRKKRKQKLAVNAIVPATDSATPVVVETPAP